MLWTLYIEEYFINCSMIFYLIVLEIFFY